MPKSTLNIDDFSGGIVTNKNPRDLDANESQDSANFVSINPGELTLSSGFILPYGYENNEGGYKGEYLSQGIISNWLVQPEYGFRQFLMVKYISNSSGYDTVEGVGLSSFTANDNSGIQVNNHGLTSGMRVTRVLPAGNTMYYPVEKVSDTQFKVDEDLDINAAGTYALLAIEATHDENGFWGPDKAPATLSPLNNRYILKTYNFGQFGFYNIGKLSPGFYGDLSGQAYPGCHGEDPWLFDIQNLWDWNQLGGAGVSIPFLSTPVVDAFYDNGHFRALMRPFRKWAYGFCRRPVSLVHIKNRICFYNDPNLTYDTAPYVDYSAYRILEGWYPLRSHILSPVEYKVDSNSTSVPQYDSQYSDLDESFEFTVDPTTALADRDASCGMVLRNYSSYTASGAGTFINDNELFPDCIHRFTLSRSSGASGNTLEGDWQFLTGDHTKLAFGVSYVYDDIEFTRQVESTINMLECGRKTDAATKWRLGNDGTSDTATFFVDSSTSELDDTALNLYLAVHRGAPKNYPLSAADLEDLGLMKEATVATVAMGEWRGSGFNSGYSNYQYINPRIVGVNIYLMGDTTGLFDDPLWLATFDYESDKKAISHDGIEGDGWDPAGFDTDSNVVGQMIRGIKKIPNITYKIKNGYSHETVTQAWYTTSAIVNRRLYAGNVSYFDFPIKRIKDQSAELEIINKPDRILVSPVNKFDILPITNFLDIITEDGQDIVKLIGFEQKLLVFKHDDLFIVDASGEFEFLENTFKGYGTWDPGKVTQTPNYIFWINQRGVYAYSKEGEVLDVVKDTIGSKKWKKHYSSSTHLSYDSEEAQLLVHCKGESDTGNDSRLLIIDVATGSVFYKNAPALTPCKEYGTGVNVNNQLFITGSKTVGGGGAGEDYDIRGQQHTRSRTSFGKGYFKLANDDSSGGKNRPGDSLNYLLVRKGSAWVLINTVQSFLTIGPVDSTQAAEYTVSKMNSALANSSSDYIVTLDYDSETEFFSIDIRAKHNGAAYNGTPVDLSSGDGANFGSEAMFAFSSTTATNGSGIHDSNVTDVSFVGLDNGVDQTAAVFSVLPRREGQENKGVMYNLTVTGKKDADDPSDSIVLSTTYVTGETDRYLSGRDGTAYTYLDDCSGVTATDDERITRNIREFLLSNPMKDQYGKDVFLDQFFIFGAINSSGSGTSFDLTARSQDTDDEMEVWDFRATVNNNTGGFVFAWSNETTDIASQPIWVSKDFDFGEPNVRKKVYKGYITYKGDKGVKVYYRVNQGNAWGQATIKDDADNQLDNSSAFVREEFTFSSDANSCYSIAIKLHGLYPIKEFVVNDITLVYRTKSVR